MQNTYDDGVDEFSRGAQPAAAADDKAAIMGGAAILFAMLATVFSVWSAGKGALRHTPEWNLAHMPLVVAVDLAVFVFSCFALKKCESMQGSLARGFSLTAVAITFLAGTVAGYSWYVFADLVAMRHV